MNCNAESFTHKHLLSILNTEINDLKDCSKLKVLDVGCGDGHLINYLLTSISEIHPTLEFDLYGFDVSDHGVQSEGFFKRTIEYLSSQNPSIPWYERLEVVSTKQKWPYPDSFFDFIISNQVVEHVLDHELFFSEIYRTLKVGGGSVHLFPLKSYIYEGHLKLPVVHRISDYDFKIAYIKFLSRLGVGKFKEHKRKYSVTLNEYAERHADYMFFYTNYLSFSEVLKLCKRHNLRASFRYTKEFYINKLRSIFGLNSRLDYSYKRSGFIDLLATHILKYVSSVTLYLQKKETYTEK